MGHIRFIMIPTGIIMESCGYVKCNLGLAPHWVLEGLDWQHHVGNTDFFYCRTSDETIAQFSKGLSGTAVFVHIVDNSRLRVLLWDIYDSLLQSYS